ncbi:hypothetical protein SDC9_166508 [bioreactor metagenome]|uniref:Uncharacterized protein n=1 Tax=bioreactor metagenome TaxID=1076179 RepID=A0A645FZL6_9ZZZZ
MSLEVWTSVFNEEVFLVGKVLVSQYSQVIQNVVKLFQSFVRSGGSTLGRTGTEDDELFMLGVDVGFTDTQVIRPCGAVGHSIYLS